MIGIKDNSNLEEVFSNSTSINYKEEYNKIFEENILLKEENKTLKEVIIKLAIKI